MPTVRGRRERVRRGGYLTRRDAAAARDTLLNPSEDHGDDAWTVGRWLRYWLTTRTSIRPSTLRSYTEHAELHLIPRLGRVRLGKLTDRQVADIVLTADTYTSVLLCLHFKTAEATARLVLAAAARNPAKRHRRRPPGGPVKSAAPQPATGPQPKRPKRSRRARARREGPPTHVPRAPHKDQGA